MDKIDKMYEIKKFLKTIYNQGISDDNNLTEKQYIRVFQNDKDKTFSNVNFFNNIDDMVKHCATKSNGVNTYYELATTNGESGTEQDLLYKYCLAFDFDKSELGDDFSYKDIMFKFKELGLWYHIIVDSGHGFHVYVMINKTNDWNKVNKVQEILCDKLGADKNAIKNTQLLRIPFTLNVKSEKLKMVRIIHMFDKSTIKPYSIDKLYSRFYTAKEQEKEKEISNRNSNYTIKTSNLPICINMLLDNGSDEGNRNSDLQKIVVSLRVRNKSLNDILNVVKEWNDKNKIPLTENELEYQTKYIYENLKFASYDCKTCSSCSACWDRVESDFEYSEDDELLIVSEKHSKDLKHKKRKDAKVMNGNELFIYNVLLNNINRKLNIDDILKLITYKKKSAMSLRVLRDTLSSLIESKYILKTVGIKRSGIKDTYEVNKVKSKIEDEITISYFCTLAVVWGVITPEELRLYTYMRYKHHILTKEGKEKGNIFRINQSELAIDLGVTQPRISMMINNLIESKILDIWENKINDRGFLYYTYRLNK